MPPSAKRTSSHLPASTSAQILDREFLTIRGKLLEVAAALDRIERGLGSASSDPRLEKIRETLAILGKDGVDRAEQLQLIFSLPYQSDWLKDRVGHAPTGRKG